MSDGYEIVLRGVVPERAIAPFLEEFDIVRTETTTTLSGQILDPSHLHGIVAHLTATGVTILRLTAVTGPDAPPSSTS